MNIITCSMDTVWMYDVQCIIMYLDVAATGELESWWCSWKLITSSPYYLGLPGHKTSLQWGLQALLMNEESEVVFFLVDRLRHSSMVQVPVLKTVTGCVILKLPGLCEVWCRYRSGRWAFVGGFMVKILMATCSENSRAAKVGSWLLFLQSSCMRSFQDKISRSERVIIFWTCWWEEGSEG